MKPQINRNLSKNFFVGQISYKSILENNKRKKHETIVLRVRLSKDIYDKYLKSISNKSEYLRDLISKDIAKKNETSIAVVEKGAGKIVVVVDSYTFNDNLMGGTFTEPEDDLRQIYNTEYYIFEELLLK